MFGDFNDQIPQVFFMGRGESRGRILEQTGELAAAQADVGAVVGQAGAGGLGHDHQIGGDDAGLPEFGDGVEPAAGKHLVAQVHVAVLLLPPGPARQAGTHEQFPIKAVRDQPVQFLLGPGGRGREKEFHLLAVAAELELLLGMLDEPLGKEEADEGFPGQFGTDAPGPAGTYRVEGEDFRGGVVVEKMAHHPFPGDAHQGMEPALGADDVGQGELEQIAHRHPHKGFSIHLHPETVGVAALGGGGIGLVGFEIGPENMAGVGVEPLFGKTDPGVFPGTPLPLGQEAFQIRGLAGGKLPGPGPADEVLVIIGGFNGFDQIHARIGAGDRGLEFVFRAGGDVPGGKGQGLHELRLVAPGNAQQSGQGGRGCLWRRGMDGFKGVLHHGRDHSCQRAVSGRRG